MVSEHANQADLCAVTGLAVDRRPEWRRMAVTDRYQDNFEVVGGRIVVSRPVGHGSATAVRRHLDAIRAVVDAAVPADARYVLVEDWNDLKGASMEARRLFIQWATGQRRQLAGLVFCRLSPMFKMSIKLGKRMNVVDIPIELVFDCRDAIRKAVQLLPDLDIDPAAFTVGDGSFPGRSGHVPSPQHPFTMPDWRIDTEGFSSRFEIIGEGVMHSVTRGTMRSEHVDQITQLREKVLRSPLIGGRIDYLITNVRDMRGMSHRARFHYMDSLMAWHRQNPLRIYIPYGFNQVLRTAAIVARAFLPFKLRTAGDLSAAMAIIDADKEKRGPGIHFMGAVEKEAPAKPPDSERAFADMLLKYLGSIRWEEDGPVPEPDLTPDHPLADVFNAIALVKWELDEMFREREAGEKEKLQLERQLQQARKMESIGTLAGGVSHDFNNILGIVQGNAELALDTVTPEHPARINIEEILIACERASGVVGQLLNFARETDAVKTPFPIGTMVRESLQLLRASFGAGIRITSHIPREPMMVKADTTQMHQLLINVCTNAAHAMERTGGRLSVVLEALDIDADDAEAYPDVPPGRYVELAIGDTGTGMDPEIVERIFDPYFTTKPVGKGTGLGLSVVHGIVKDHDGHVRVASTPGTGTMFRFLFPRIDAELPGRAADRPALPTGSERILMVDDEAQIVRAGVSLLGTLGYRAEGFTSPAAALAAFSEAPKRYDLVITDMAMPELSGDQLGRAINNLRPDIPVLLATGYHESMMAEKINQARFSGCLTKPLNKQRLSGEIRRVLDAPSADDR